MRLLETVKNAGCSRLQEWLTGESWKWIVGVANESGMGWEIDRWACPGERDLARLEFGADDQWVRTGDWVVSCRTVAEGESEERRFSD